jgi:hypothetical protein
MATQKKGGGNKKYGNNKKWCEVYRSLGRRETNKKRKLASHIRRFPEDTQAFNRLRALTEGVSQRGYS